MNRWDRRDWVILLALTLLAAILRLYRLGTVPPGFQFDEAFNALDAARVLQGERPLFLPDNNGREAFYTYLQAGLASLLGLSVYTLRLTSALAGIATIPVTYLLLRALLRQESRRVAAFTSLALAISLWHLHFSHYGIRVILMPLLFSGVCGFFWLAAQRGWPWAYVLSGAFVGLSVWTHPTGRIIPLVLIGYALWLRFSALHARSERGNGKPWYCRSPRGRLGPMTGLLVAGLVAFLIFLPLGIYFYHQPALFLRHISAVSIFADPVSDGSPVRALWVNMWRVLGMFSIQGDREWIHNLAGRPVFDPLLSIPFWLGLAVWLLRLRQREDPDRDALALLLGWSLVMLLPSVFSDAAPNFSRTLPALPALFVAVGLGLVRLMELLWRPHWLGGGLVALILVFSGGLSVYDYFVRFPQRPEVYYAYDVDKLDAWAYLQPLTEDHQLYLSQLWAEHGTLRYLTRRSKVKSLGLDNMVDTVVLPPLGRGAAYAFPAEQTEYAERLAAVWAGAATLTHVPDRYGRLLLTVVTVEAEALRYWPATLLPTKQLIARFTGAPTLVGMRDELADGQIVLYWQAEQRMPRSLTAFVHLLDREGQRVGQADRLPGNGGYITSNWTLGDRVIERYRLDLTPCAGGEEVSVITGWYDLAADAARIPRADAPGDTALVGQAILPVLSHPPDVLSPRQVLDQPMGQGLRLWGYEMHIDAWEAGALLILDLYWIGDVSVSDQPLTLGLRGEGNPQTIVLWRGPVAPSELTRWRSGEAICRRLRVRLPTGAIAGRYHLWAEVGEEAALLGELTLQPSARN
ncbi:MAG: glycosyltransferase family 39 protein [Anaerolineae bacterium]|nr:glycosyltransferase family 39 protein [Anaerolineae bacterium]MDW8100394.1 glycosyltransferase family 39 protein [Anaerolineae bacterium]